MSSTLLVSFSLSALVAGVSLAVSVAVHAAPRSQPYKPSRQYIDCSSVRTSGQALKSQQPVVSVAPDGVRTVALPCSRKPAR